MCNTSLQPQPETWHGWLRGAGNLRGPARSSLDSTRCQIAGIVKAAHLIPQQFICSEGHMSESSCTFQEGAQLSRIPQAFHASRHPERTRHRLLSAIGALHEKLIAAAGYPYGDETQQCQVLVE